MKLPDCEATSLGFYPKSFRPEDIEAFRKKVDPDMMGFLGTEYQKEGPTYEEKYPDAKG